MDSRGIIIAIDGYSSTGKSTFARDIAEKYDLTYVDTGALYRGVTLALLERGVDVENVPKEEIEKILQQLSFAFKYCDESGDQSLHLNGRNIEREIRSLEVAGAVSKVAPLPIVRNFVDSMLRGYGDRGDIVMEGRDIGTVLFPNADLKIFMIADAEIRAKRRYDEMISKGYNPDYQEVLKNIIERDRLDENRESAPLKKADDAIVLDNTNLTIEGQQQWIEKILKERWGSRFK